MKAHPRPTGQGAGYIFGGERAEKLKARLRAIKRDPSLAAKLFGNPPKRGE